MVRFGWGNPAGADAVFRVENWLGFEDLEPPRSGCLAIAAVESAETLSGGSMFLGMCEF